MKSEFFLLLFYMEILMVTTLLVRAHLPGSPADLVRDRSLERTSIPCRFGGSYKGRRHDRLATTVQFDYHIPHSQVL